MLNDVLCLGGDLALIAAIVQKKWRLPMTPVASIILNWCHTMEYHVYTNDITQHFIPLNYSAYVGYTNPPSNFEVSGCA